jgi:Protein of unknown function (DUF3987)
MNTHTFRWGANTDPRCLDKNDAYRLAEPTAWTPQSGTMADLVTHITSGHAWMPALLDQGARRNKISANTAEVLALDIDDGLTIAEAIVLIESGHPVWGSCGLIIESASSTPEREKFRAVFALKEHLVGHELIERAIGWMLSQVPEADQKCSTPQFFFHGATGRSPQYIDTAAILELPLEQVAAFPLKSDKKRKAPQAGGLRIDQLAVPVSRSRGAAPVSPGELQLVACLGPNDRALLEGGVGEGSRNSTAFSLGSNLLGTAGYLDSIGQRYSGNPKQLYNDFCDRCSPAIDDNERAATWASVERSNPGPSLSTDKIENCIAAWKTKSQTTERPRVAQNNVVQMREMADPGDMPAEIYALLDRNLSGSALETEKIKLRQTTAMQPFEFDRLWARVEAEYDAADSDDGAIAQLLDGGKPLDLTKILPPDLARPILLAAQNQNLRPELYLVCLLATVGSLAQNGTELVLHKGESFSVTPNIFAAIVAPPSQKKSPVLKAIATGPMRVLNREARTRYAQEHVEWELAQKAANEKGEGFFEPAPEREIHYFTNATGEGILSQAGRCPKRGLLAISDELAGYFKSANQYRGGRGSDNEDLLSYYDGHGGLSLRVDGVRSDVETLNLGVLGGIQPGVLERFLGDCQDSNGGWARFIFVNQPIAASTLPEEHDGTGLADVLIPFYQQIRDLEPRKYSLTPGAFAHFKKAYDNLERERQREVNPALQAALGKLAGRVGKIALCLHLLDAAVNFKLPADQVDEATIRRACRITRLSLNELRAIYAKCDPLDLLTPVLARIIELSKRRGEISAREVSQGLPPKGKPCTAEIRRLFSTLAAQGWGEVSGTGKAIAFTAYPERREMTDAEQREVS